MKFWKLATAATVIMASSSANAAIISYGGYTHDDTTDIVTGNGLEWLQWDRTLGYSGTSIQNQLDTIEGGGWRIASHVDMAQLFNAFDFGLTFDTVESTDQRISTGFSAGDPGTETDILFISMFGDTYAAAYGGPGCYSGDCSSFSVALFGSLDPQHNYHLSRAVVRDDDDQTYLLLNAGYASMSREGYLESLADPAQGIALVRDASPVPVPAAAWLFGSGLMGLIGVARRKVRA